MFTKTQFYTQTQKRIANYLGFVNKPLFDLLLCKG